MYQEVEVRDEFAEHSELKSTYLSRRFETSCTHHTNQVSVSCERACGSTFVCTSSHADCRHSRMTNTDVVADMPAPVPFVRPDAEKPNPKLGVGQVMWSADNRFLMTKNGAPGLFLVCSPVYGLFVSFFPFLMHNVLSARMSWIAVFLDVIRFFLMLLFVAVMLINDVDRAQSSHRLLSYFSTTLVNRHTVFLVADNMPNAIWIWETTKLSLASVIIQLDPIKGAHWDPVRPRLALCTGTEKVYLWNADGCSFVNIPIENFNVRKLRWNSDGNSLLLMDKKFFCCCYPDAPPEE